MGTGVKCLINRAGKSTAARVRTSGESRPIRESIAFRSLLLTRDSPSCLGTWLSLKDAGGNLRDAIHWAGESLGRELQDDSGETPKSYPGIDRLFLRWTGPSIYRQRKNG
jgi:hypothetical protein